MTAQNERPDGLVTFETDHRGRVDGSATIASHGNSRRARPLEVWFREVEREHCPRVTLTDSDAGDTIVLTLGLGDHRDFRAELTLEVAERIAQSLQRAVCDEKSARAQTEIARRFAADDRVSD